MGGCRVWVGFVIATLLPPAVAAGGGTNDAAGVNPRAFTFRQVQMGGEFRLKLYAGDEASANRSAAAVGRRIKTLSAALSDYHPDSELNRLCDRYRVGVPEPVGEDLFRVLIAAREVGERSGGAFDVTVAPLVKLWRIARRRRELPTADELAAARDRVGYDRYVLDPRARTVTFTAPGVRLDLGGIAKGYAADVALGVLHDRGIAAALIDAGGDLRLGDPPPGRDGWTVGLASLAAPDAPPTRFVTLSNCAVATSGDAYRAVEIGGVRYSHIVDPRTGLGLTERSSVTVVARTGIEADALASALSVLGPERGVALIEGSCVAEGLIVTRRRGETASDRSTGFPSIKRAPLAAPRPRPAMWRLR